MLYVSLNQYIIPPDFSKLIPHVNCSHHHLIRDCPSISSRPAVALFGMFRHGSLMPRRAKNCYWYMIGYEWAGQHKQFPWLLIHVCNKGRASEPYSQPVQFFPCIKTCVHNTLSCLIPAVWCQLLVDILHKVVQVQSLLAIFFSTFILSSVISQRKQSFV